MNEFSKIKSSGKTKSIKIMLTMAEQNMIVLNFIDKRKND